MTSAPFDLAAYLDRRRAEVESALDAALPPEAAPPASIHRAIRYAVFAGGKRLRPILVLAGCEAAGGKPSSALPFACAVECVHTYSLVHDDLPALDDDDLRRGRPTVHRAFGEATAILTGDALLTIAFETALERDARSRGGTEIPDTRRLAALGELVSAIGTSGMIGGQVDDLLAAAAGEEERSALDEARVRSIHDRKTGALLRACPVIGGILAGADADALGRLGAYGADLGLAFQIVDDILDVEGDASTLGKSARKDAAAGKATFPAVLGIERSRARAQSLAERAASAATPLGPAAAPLAAIAEYAVRRNR